jgi:transcriptional regulator with XRE-family HTH domain
MITEIEKKIRNIRELKDLKQEYVAKQLGISTRAYSKIETGETQLTIARLNEISQVFGIAVEEILGFDKSLIFNNNPINQQGGKYVAYNNTDVERIEALYKALLDEKERTIQMLMNKK